MSIKYYHLAKDETPPEEFCAIRDVSGEPSEYMFYVQEAENAKLRDDLETQREAAWQNTNRNAREYKRVCDENDRLRELAKNLKACNSSCGRCIELFGKCDYEAELRELGVESWE